MGDQNDITVEEIMQQIRERVRLRRESEKRTATTPATSAPYSEAISTLPLYDLQELRSNVITSNLLCNHVGTINPRPRGWHNDFIQLIKKSIRRMLTWYTQSIQVFNGSIARSLNETTRALENAQANLTSLADCVAQWEQLTLGRLEGMQNELVDLEALQEGSETQRKELAARLSAWEGRLGQMEQTQRKLDIGRFDERLLLSERTLRRLVHSGATENAARASAPAEQRLPTANGTSSSTDEDFDYYWFEERFRGSELEIKERQRAYLELFRGRHNVLDIGCGRGEFLELMKDNGVSARGIDMNIDMILRCQEKGLEAVQGDVYTHLGTLPDASLGGLFCSQVVEHMTTRQQVQLVGLIRNKLMPGAPLVIETVNPQCFIALANFFIDPTHVRPVHPLTLKFMLESCGFKDVKLRFSSPVNSDREVPRLDLPLPEPQLRFLNESLERVNSLLLGFQDYAAIAEG